MEYIIRQNLKGFDVTLFVDQDEYSFTVPSWEDVVEYFADWGIVPTRPAVEEKVTPGLTWRPFECL